MCMQGRAKQSRQREAYLIVRRVAGFSGLLNSRTGSDFRDPHGSLVDDNSTQLPGRPLHLLVLSIERARQ